MYLGRVDDKVECLALGPEYGTGVGWLQLERERSEVKSFWLAVPHHSPFLSWRKVESTRREGGRSYTCIIFNNPSDDV